VVVDDGDELLALVVRLMRQRAPAWHRDAACREHERSLWFPTRGEPTSPAKEVCRRCLVQTECLRDALEADELVGIWGGTSGNERVKLRRRVA
jgi:WhiB family transcriptional regulator, redox-sensing transcriptional regulator